MRSGNCDQRLRCRPVVLFVLFCIAVTSCLALRSGENIWPQQGQTTASSGKLVVDYSHAEDGYIMVKAPASKKKLKIRVKLGDSYYNYDINSDGAYDVYPLQLGSGSYTVILYENASGKQYSQKAKVSFKATVGDEFAAFLCPSKYVWYTEDSVAVTLSHTLCDQLSTDAEKLQAVRSYMKNNLMYDYIRSYTQKEAYVGDAELCLTDGKGLCQDLACVMAAMLRVQGIPCQLAVGEVMSPSGTISHAWNYVFIDGEYVRVDITAVICNSANSKYTPDKLY